MKNHKKLAILGVAAMALMLSGCTLPHNRYKSSTSPTITAKLYKEHDLSNIDLGELSGRKFLSPDLGQLLVRHFYAGHTKSLSSTATLIDDMAEDASSRNARDLHINHHAGFRLHNGYVEAAPSVSSSKGDFSAIYTHLMNAAKAVKGGGYVTYTCPSTI